MSKKLKLMITGILAVTAITALSLLLTNRPSAHQLVSVEQGPMAQTITETAELYAYNSAALYTKAPETIATVHTSVGQWVAQGDLLVTFDGTSNLQLAQLKAQRQAAAAQYDGQIASAAQLLEQAAQTASDTQKQYTRQKQLFDAGALSQQALESAETNRAQANTAVSTRQTELSVLRTQKEAQLAQIDAAMAILAQQNQDTVLTAPFDGLVTECPFSAGASLPIGTLVAEVQDPNRLYLEAKLLMEDAASLQHNTAVSAFQEDYGVQIDALTISQIGPKALQTTSALGVDQKRVPIQIALPEGALSIPLGSPWEVTFTLSSAADALWLPKAAVYTRDGQNRVLLPDGRTEQAVTTGILQEDRVQILDGLSLGQQVLLPE